MKKSSKKFAVSTEKKNDKGFRVKTSGIDITGYEQNPIMLMMHQRPTGTNRNEAGVIGNFVDLHFADNKLFGTPSFDDTDEYALKLYNKVENNIMRMCSAGLIPLKWGKDNAGDIWLLESKLLEISLADVGSNSEAFAVNLYADNGTELITLSLDQIEETLKPQININMKTIELKTVAPLLKLSADATPEAGVLAIQNLVTLAADQAQKIETLTTEKEAVEGKLETATETLENQVKLATETANKQFVELAAAAGKFVQGDVPKWIALMAKAPKETKEIIEAMLPQKSVLEQLKSAEDNEDALVKLTYDQLDKSGQLEALKASNEVVFKAKYKEKFNTDYQG